MGVEVAVGGWLDSIKRLRRKIEETRCQSKKSQRERKRKVNICRAKHFHPTVLFASQGKKEKHKVKEQKNVVLQGISQKISACWLWGRIGEEQKTQEEGEFGKSQD